MSEPWAILTSIAGALLVVVALRDIWVTLFRPTSQGVLSHFVTRAVWRAVRATAGRRPGWLRHAGPAAMPMVMLTWAVLQTLGWTLIFWARMPEGFAIEYADGPTANAFAESLYLSMVTLATLGYGDITPTAGYLRLLAPIETVIGFVLLTASITWVLSVYPALTRQRALAHQVSLLQEAEAQTGLDTFARAPQTAERTLAGFCSQLAVVRSDFVQFPVTYYFYDIDDRCSLALALPKLLELAETAERSDTPGLRLQGAELREVIEDVAETLSLRVLQLSTTEVREVLAAYARDHLRE